MQKTIGSRLNCMNICVWVVAAFAWMLTGCATSQQGNIKNFRTVIIQDSTSLAPIETLVSFRSVEQKAAFEQSSVLTIPSESVDESDEFKDIALNDLKTKEKLLTQLAYKGENLLEENETFGDFAGLPLVWPLKRGNFRISSLFGVRSKRFHAGLDLAAPAGTPVRAAAEGQVVLVGYKGAYGNLVVINHTKNRQTVYAHLSGFNVKEGMIVKAGDVIGFVGSTGRSTGHHLHFETRIDGKPLDPLRFLPPLPSSGVSMLFPWDERLIVAYISQNVFPQ